MTDWKLKKISRYFDNTYGYLVYPSTLTTTGKKVPAIIMIHEWWGINDNIRTMANTPAKQAGYVILAVDLFKGQSTKEPSYTISKNSNR
jgi:carboxymethylenebutenolidase